VNDANQYDLILKDLFQRDRPSLLDRLTGGIAIREFLNVELPKVQERRVDLVLLLEDGTVLHIEFQGKNDRAMGYREGIYGLLLAQRRRCRVRQVVLYVGEAKMSMSGRLDAGSVQVAYEPVDIREMDAQALLESARPGDLALAVLVT